MADRMMNMNPCEGMEKPESAKTILENMDARKGEYGDEKWNRRVGDSGDE